MAGCLGVMTAREAFFGVILDTGLEIPQTTGHEISQAMGFSSFFFQAGLGYMGVDLSTQALRNCKLGLIFLL